MSPSPLPGVSPLVATSKSSTSQSSIQQSSQQNHNLAIPSTSYGLTPPLNITKSSSTLISQKQQQQQQKNIILHPPKMIIQNDKNSDKSDNSSIGGSNIKNNNIPDIISAKETIISPSPPTSSNESILLNKTSVNNTSHLIKNDNKQQQQQQQQQIRITNKNNNKDELNRKNQLISDIKMKEDKHEQNTSSSSSTDTKSNVDKQKNNKNDDNNDDDDDKKKDNNDEKSIIVFDVSKKREIFLKNLNKHIICNLCQGYLIDATTIVECLHSFCHSCIMKHLRTEQYCPRCEMMINTAKPNIKPDTTLQAIVYKIVPGLYEKELMRKRAFYRDRPEDAAIVTPEQRGEDTEHLIFSPTENMSLSLEYADMKEFPSGSSDDIYGLKTPKYLQCPASLTVAHLKKFVLMKFAIDSELFMVEIMYKVKTIVLYDHYTLMDVAYIYTWKRDAPMRFFFRVKETDNYVIKLEKFKRRNLINKNEMKLNLNKEIIVSNKIDNNDNKCKIEKINETKIKIESTENNKFVTAAYDSSKKFEIVQNPKNHNTNNNNNNNSEKTEKIKITLVGKNKYPKITSPNQLTTKNDLILSTKSTTNHQQKSIKSMKNSSSTIYNQSTKFNNNNITTGSSNKLENIKMKIDISKQDSIKIINMSGPDSMPKEIVKSVKPEKEWKIKIKKDDKHSTSPKTSSSSSSTKDSDNNNKKRKSLSPLTVPPITIKAEKLSPIPKNNIKISSPIPKDDSNSSNNNNNNKLLIGEKDEEEKKSEFLNSFALTPIKNISPEKQINKNKPNNLPEIKVVPTKNLMGPPLKPVTISKRKNKEPIKSTSKKQKFDFADILTPENFTKKKIDKDIVKQQQQSPKEMISFGLSPYPIGGSNTSNITNNNNKKNCEVLINGKPLHKFNNDDKLMPAPPPLKVLETAVKKNGIKLSQKQQQQQQQNNNNDINKNMKFPIPNKLNNNNNNKIMQRNHNIAPPGSTTPHPMIPSGIASSKAAMAAPGNRTPITKRYPTILPKQSITNPFANIPNEVNKILQDSGTEIKHISPNEDGVGINSVKVYGPSMNITTTSSSTPSKLSIINQSSQISSNMNKNNNNVNNKSSINNQSYLNYALYNSSKTRGNEVPPGCRTPMYTPNSPIYSPNSPQYIPNYNIPIQPTYKYAPKSTTNVNSYLQNVLGQNKQMSGLFPGPPVKKSNNNNNNNNNDDNNIKNNNSSSISSSSSSPPTNNNNFDIDMKKNQNENQKLNYPYSKTPPNNNNNDKIKNEPEKQIKVKSLLTSCNINIPSSLSITITNEDSDSKLNNSLNPKHKSPVNNYIEILKLPDQTLQEQNNNNDNNKNDQQNQNQIKDDIITTPTKIKDIELLSNKNNNSLSGNTKTVMTMNTPRSSPMPFNNNTIKTTTISPSTNLCQTSTNSITTNTSPMNINKKLIEQPKKSPSEMTTTPKENKLIGKNGQNNDKNNLTTTTTTTPTINNKKTPSPEKKSPLINENKKRLNSDKKTSPSENGQKLNKNDNNQNQQQQQPPTKKFRHILPRTPTTQQQQQIITNTKQTIPSPTITPPKQITKIQQQIPQQQQIQKQQQSPTNFGIRTNFPNTSNGCIVGIKTNQQTNKNNNNNLKKNDNNNFMNTLIKSPQQQQQLTSQQQQSINLNNNNNNNIIDNLQPVTVTSSANNNNNNINNIQRPNSTDMTNFFNETILRAACAANAANVAAVNNTNGSNCINGTTNTNSNIFLPHLAAAAAANFGHHQYSPINFNPYNFQQAMVLEQYARYNLEKLAQNLKNNSNINNNNNNRNNSNSPKGNIQTITTAGTTVLNGNSNIIVSDCITGTTGTKEKTV